MFTSVTDCIFGNLNQWESFRNVLSLSHALFVPCCTFLSDIRETFVVSDASLDSCLKDTSLLFMSLDFVRPSVSFSAQRSCLPST